MVMADERRPAALDLTEPQHRVVSAVVTEDVFELACSCGWQVTSPDGLEILDAWADHCIESSPTRPGAVPNRAI